MFRFNDAVTNTNCTCTTLSNKLLKHRVEKNIFLYEIKRHPLENIISTFYSSSRIWLKQSLKHVSLSSFVKKKNSKICFQLILIQKYFKWKNYLLDTVTISFNRFESERRCISIFVGLSKYK